MKFTPAGLKDAYFIDLEPFSDERGWFARTYCQQEFAAIGFQGTWVQINHSLSREKGTIRGMHFQHPPHTEAKLVRCIAGVVFDVIVDLRQDSPTFSQWTGVELSAINRKMIFIPEGFAHGFQTLSENVELIYHHSAFYHPGSEGGIRYDDPAVGIEWPLPPGNISLKDQQRTSLSPGFTGIQ